MIPYSKTLLFSLVVCALIGCSQFTPTAGTNRQSNSSVQNPQERFQLNKRDYFQNRGVGVMVFHDTFPESHQSGLIMVMHGNRIATNGDLRLEATPGQWSPVPKIVSREVDRERGEIRTRLAYPDEKQHLKGFNPIYYPDLQLTYEMTVRAEGDAIKVRIDLDQPLPEQWVGKVGFVLELYPVDLFGMSWIMDERTGIFPRQPYGVELPEGVEPHSQLVSIGQLVPTGEFKDLIPLSNHRAQPVPLATGKTLAVATESDELRMQIHSSSGELELHDGRN